jgi:outer membrane protein TolC
MTEKGSKLFLTFFLFITLQHLKAQESMMTDVSYVYMEKLVAVAMENYPRVKSGESRIRSGELNITKAKLNWLAPVSLSYVHSPANSLNILNPTFFSGYQLGLFFNIGSFLQTPFGVKTAKEDLKIIKNDVEEYKLTLSTEVKRRYISYIQALKLLQISSKAAIDAQTDAAMVKFKFERGEVTLSEYNNTLDRLRAQNLSKINAEGGLLIAKASLEELLGVKLEEVR